MKILPKQRNEQVLRGAHVSMQFSDHLAQMEKDADKIFRRAKEQKYRYLTGTEAGGKTPLLNVLKKYAQKYGYWIAYEPGQDCWIALLKTAVVDILDVDFEKVIDGEAGKWTNKGPMWVTYNDRVFGEVSILAAHYLTKGKPGDGYYSQNLQRNTSLARAIGEKARELGQGKAIVLYAGDQNIIDRTDDTFLGVAPLTSLWDELNKYSNTGHGNIDVMASYDRDHRVRGKSIKALNDKKFSLYTDHFLIEGEWYVRVPQVFK